MGGVYIHTLGCPKNEADSDALSSRLRSEGVSISDDPAAASHIVLNTCGFIEDAREESIGAILSIARDYPKAELLAMGCLVERYRDELEQGLPEVAGWYGLSDTGPLVQRLTMESGEPREDTARSGSERRSPAMRPGHRPRSYGYIKVSDGCDHLCTFCAIPLIKGPYRALGVAEITEAAGRALDEGARELVLVGQDTTVWAHDDVDLVGLVDHLASDPRVARIRLMYLQPEHVDDRLLESMAAHPTLCRYLDIPFQHASGGLLRKMGRRGDATSYLELLRQARRSMPDVSVRSTFIVGFPGETDDDVEALLSFIDEAGFEHAGVFAYSPEEGTKACGMTPVVPEEVVRERLAEVSARLADASEAAVACRIGSTAQVLVDEVDDVSGPEGTVAVGRTDGQAPEVDGVTYLVGAGLDRPAVGDLIRVVVTESIGYDLVAEPILD
jgi:ribosomal protein S12 methylthiotransferase